MTVVTGTFYNYYYILFTNYFGSMFSCLRARGFRKTYVTSVICHELSEELKIDGQRESQRRVKSEEWASLLLFCALQLGELVGFHLFRRPADDDETSATAGADSLEAKFYEGSAYVDGTELLADAGTDDLQGSRHGHELACLFGTRLAEVQVHQLLFEMRGLELSIMLVQLLDFFFLKPILKAALVEGIGFGIDGIVVEGVLSGRADALHLEGQPTAVACGVAEELGVVASAAEGGYVLAMLMIVGVGCSLVDARHRDDGLELVQLGRAHRVEFLAADEGVLGKGEEVVLAHAVRIGLRVEVLLQRWWEEVVEPGGFEGALFAYQHEDDVVDGVVGEPTGDHGDEPLLQVILPAVLFALSAFYRNGEGQFVNWGVFPTTPSLLNKEGSTALPKPLSPQGRGDVTAPTRRSEPLRFKVVGGIKAPRLVFYATELRLFVRCFTALLRECLRLGLLRGSLWGYFCRFLFREFRVVPCETFKILCERIEGDDVIGLDDAVEVLLVDSRYRGHFCPKGVDSSVINREPIFFQVFYSCGDFIIA